MALSGAVRSSRAMRHSVAEFARTYLHADERHSGTGFLVVLLGGGCALSAAALAGISATVGPVPLLHAFVRADWAWLPLVAIAVTVSHLGYTLAYWEVARPDDDSRLGLPEAFRLVTTGFAPLSPRTGYSIDVWELTQRGVDRAAAQCRIRLLGLLEYAVLAPGVFVAAWVMAARGVPAQDGLLPSWLIGVPAGTLATALLLVANHRTQRQWWAPLRNQLDAIGDLLRLLRSWQRAPLAVLGMGLYWAAEISALACCLEMFAKTRGGIAAMIVGYATGYALTRRALPLAGAGAVEALMPFALNWVGYPLAAATLAVIAYRVFNMWLPMIPAVIALRRLEDDRANTTDAEDQST